MTTPKKTGSSPKWPPAVFVPAARTHRRWSARCRRKLLQDGRHARLLHPAPLYRIEGDPKREGDGIYDRMRTVGAHEVLIENPKHDHQLWNTSDTEIRAIP